MYTGEVKEGGNEMENFEIAEKFKIDGMKWFWENELMGQLENSNAYYIFMIGHRYSSVILKKQAFIQIGKMLGGIPDEFMENPEELREQVDIFRSFQQQTLWRWQHLKLLSSWCWTLHQLWVSIHIFFRDVL